MTFFGRSALWSLQNIFWHQNIVAAVLDFKERGANYTCNSFIADKILVRVRIPFIKGSLSFVTQNLNVNQKIFPTGHTNRDRRGYPPITFQSRPTSLEPPLRAAPPPLPGFCRCGRSRSNATKCQPEAKEARTLGRSRPATHRQTLGTSQRPGYSRTVCS